MTVTTNSVLGSYPDAGRNLGSASGGTGSVVAPGLISQQGFSNEVAAAMEALSAAMPKDSRWNDPRIAEQGVIELGHGKWTLERTINIDLTTASQSRWGLTIRGNGRASTILHVPSTASAANFKGSDNIWRALKVTGNTGSQFAHLNFHDFQINSYATQNGDGSTKLSDEARWLDLKRTSSTSLRNLFVYARNHTGLSKNQYCYSLDSCYYSTMDSCFAQGFGDTNVSAPLLDGTSSLTQAGVGFRLVNNNAFTATGCTAYNVNLAWHLINEDGTGIFGGSTENYHKAFLFDGDSSECRVYGFRAESSVLSNGLSMPGNGEVYFAMFTELTKNNVVEQYLRDLVPRALIFDYSQSNTNKVVTNERWQRRSVKDLLSGAAWTNSAGTTTVAGASSPSSLDPSVTSSIQVTMDGTYSRTRHAGPITVNPDWGMVTFRVFAKRLSGAGFMNPEITTQSGTTSSVLWKSQPQSDYIWSGVTTLPLATSGHSWAAGKLTVTTAREHGLQPGMRIKSNASSSWGSSGTPIAANTEMYVESVPSATSLVLIAAAAGALNDPGTMTSPAAAQIPGDMSYWQFAENVTDGWKEFIRGVQIRYAVRTAPSLDGSNQAVISIANVLLGVGTGTKLKLSGFADSRLNATYTVLAGDVSGNNLTLTGLGALVGLVTTATDHIASTDAAVQDTYGYVGCTELYVHWRCTTINTGQNIVWEVAGESLFPGAERTYESA